MVVLPNFDIKSGGEISEAFLKMRIVTFQDACRYIGALPYGRNADKNNLMTIFVDKCGTCSTKHALLKKLADENAFEGLRLMLGIFKMSAQFNKVLVPWLTKHHLAYIPEAHNYLRFENEILDFTKRDSSASAFKDDLLFEKEISPEQITHYKVEFHRQFLKKWLEENRQLEYDLEELWNIRERCIELLRD